jgi:hypothetical protein
MVGARKVVKAMVKASRLGAAEVDGREMRAAVGVGGRERGGKCAESIICNNKRICKIKIAPIG